MHTEVKHHLRAVKKRFPQYFRFKRVLEAGSQNINGSPRPFFWFCKYVGVDLGPGRGVDVVCPIAAYEDKELFDVVLSCEMAEHDETWEASFIAMFGNLKPGGLLIITCAGPKRAEHGTRRSEPECSPFTTDYYRNISKEDFKSVLPLAMFQACELRYERDGEDLMFWGIKW